MKTIAEIDTLEPPVDGTDDREARSFRWYAARTQMNCERKAVNVIKDVISDSYIPVQEEIHQWSDRKKKVQRLVIPMIAFVKMDKAIAKEIRSKSCFLGLLKNPGSDKPSYIPEEQILTLKFMLENSENPVNIETMPLRVGDRIRIIKGNLKGLEGNVLMHKDGSSSVLVKIDLLGYARVNIVSSELELIQ
jgi:transcription antitermination factor NusG